MLNESQYYRVLKDAWSDQARQRSAEVRAGRKKGGAGISRGRDSYVFDKGGVKYTANRSGMALGSGYNLYAGNKYLGKYNTRSEILRAVSIHARVRKKDRILFKKELPK